eukprot:gene3545-7055_t
MQEDTPMSLIHAVIRTNETETETAQNRSHSQSPLNFSENIHRSSFVTPDIDINNNGNDNCSNDNSNDNISQHKLSSLDADISQTHLKQNGKQVLLPSTMSVGTVCNGQSISSSSSNTTQLPVVSLGTELGRVRERVHSDVSVSCGVGVATSHFGRATSRLYDNDYDYDNITTTTTTFRGTTPAATATATDLNACMKSEGDMNTPIPVPVSVSLAMATATASTPESQSLSKEGDPGRYERAQSHPETAPVPSSTPYSHSHSNSHHSHSLGITTTVITSPVMTFRLEGMEIRLDVPQQLPIQLPLSLPVPPHVYERNDEREERGRQANANGNGIRYSGHQYQSQYQSPYHVPPMVMDSQFFPTSNGNNNSNNNIHSTAFPSTNTPIAITNTPMTTSTHQKRVDDVSHGVSSLINGSIRGNISSPSHSPNHKSGSGSGSGSGTKSGTGHVIHKVGNAVDPMDLPGDLFKSVETRRTVSVNTYGDAETTNRSTPSSRRRQWDHVDNDDDHWDGSGGKDHVHMSGGSAGRNRSNGGPRRGTEAETMRTTGEASFDDDRDSDVPMDSVVMFHSDSDDSGVFHIQTTSSTTEKSNTNINKNTKTSRSSNHHIEPTIHRRRDDVIDGTISTHSHSHNNTVVAMGTPTRTQTVMVSPDAASKARYQSFPRYHRSSSPPASSPSPISYNNRHSEHSRDSKGVSNNTSSVSHWNYTNDVVYGNRKGDGDVDGDVDGDGAYFEGSKQYKQHLHQQQQHLRQQRHYGSRVSSEFSSRNFPSDPVVLTAAAETKAQSQSSSLHNNVYKTLHKSDDSDSIGVWRRDTIARRDIHHSSEEKDYNTVTSRENKDKCIERDKVTDDKRYRDVDHQYRDTARDRDRDRKSQGREVEYEEEEDSSDTFSVEPIEHRHGHGRRRKKSSSPLSPSLSNMVIGDRGQLIRSHSRGSRFRAASDVQGQVHEDEDIDENMYMDASPMRRDKASLPFDEGEGQNSENDDEDDGDGPRAAVPDSINDDGDSDSDVNHDIDIVWRGHGRHQMGHSRGGNRRIRSTVRQVSQDRQMMTRDSEDDGIRGQVLTAASDDKGRETVSLSATTAARRREDDDEVLRRVQGIQNTLERVLVSVEAAMDSCVPLTSISVPVPVSRRDRFVSSRRDHINMDIPISTTNPSSYDVDIHASASAAKRGPSPVSTHPPYLNGRGLGLGLGLPQRTSPSQTTSNTTITIPRPPPVTTRSSIWSSAHPSSKEAEVDLEGTRRGPGGGLSRRPSTPVPDRRPLRDNVGATSSSNQRSVSVDRASRREVETVTSEHHVDKSSQRIHQVNASEGLPHSTIRMDTVMSSIRGSNGDTALGNDEALSSIIVELYDLVLQRTIKEAQLKALKSRHSIGYRHSK